MKTVQKKDRKYTNLLLRPEVIKALRVKAASVDPELELDMSKIAEAGIILVLPKNPAEIKKIISSYRSEA